MKFGKQLVKASMVSVQLCEPQLWLDYKKLKKFLKNIQPSNGQKISHSLDERKFFTLLKSELEKVSKTFDRLQLKVTDKTNTLNGLSVTDGDYLSKRLQLMTSLHLSLILLESYAVLNHVGFRKILKKHDKLTGFATTQKYMDKVVGQEMFSNHYWIRDALFSLEEDFASMKKTLNVKARSDIPNPEQGAPTRQKPKKRKREEKADFINHRKEYLQEFAHHQQQYESMEMTTMGYLKQKQQRKKQKRKQKKKPAQRSNVVIPSNAQDVEEKTSVPVGLTPIDKKDDFENRKKQAQVALESLAMAAEAHLLL